MNSRPPYRTLTLAKESTPTFRLARWSRINGHLVMILSLLLPLIILIQLSGVVVIQNGLLAMLVTMFWQILFARRRGQAPGGDMITTALLFALLMPTGYSVWQMILGISFGVVVGEQLYGGRGYSFLHPVITGLAFLLYSFPIDNPVVNNSVLTYSVLPGLLLLLFFRLIDWRTLLSCVMGVLIIHYAMLESFPAQLPGSLLVAGVLFTVLDPAVGTITRQGRWIYGLLIGCLITAIDYNLQSLHAFAFAALLGSITAPLIDWVVIQLKTTRVRAGNE